MVRVATRKMGYFRLRVEDTPIRIHEESVNPFQNEIVNIPLICPSIPWPRETHFNHTANI